MVLIPFVLVGVTGWLFLALLRCRSSLLACCEGDDVPTLFGVGAVLLHIEFLLASWGGAVAFWHLAIVPAVLAGGLLWRLRGRDLTGAGSVGQAIGWPIWGGLILLLGIQIVSLLPTLQLPLFDWEGRMLWALKARFLEESASIVAEPFRDPYRLHIHPRYPLLVPWLTSLLARAAGGFREIHHLAVVLSFALLTTWQLYLTLVRRLGYRLAIVLGLILLLSSSWYTAAINQQVEIVLAFFLVTALSRLLAWLVDKRPEDLILAAILLAGGAMTKNEGLLLAITVCLAVALVTMLQGRQQLKNLWVLPSLSALLCLPWLFQQQAIPAVADENYLHRFNLAALQSGLERLPLILRSMLTRMTDWELWHLFWLMMPLLLLASLLPWRKTAPDRLLIALVWIGYFCGVLLVYIVSPWRDMTLHIGASFDRVVLPLFPCGVLLLGLWCQAPIPSGQRKAEI